MRCRTSLRTVIQQQQLVVKILLAEEPVRSLYYAWHGHVFLLQMNTLVQQVVRVSVETGRQHHRSLPPLGGVLLSATIIIDLELGSMHVLDDALGILLSHGEYLEGLQ